MHAVAREKKTRSDGSSWRKDKRKDAGDGGDGFDNYFRGDRWTNSSNSNRKHSSPKPEGFKSKFSDISPVVLLLVGLPGSGKSTLSEKFLKKGWWIISQDRLGSRNKCISEFRKALSRGRNIVVDRCNHTRAQRETWVREAVTESAKQSFRVRVYALCLNTDIGECRSRVLARGEGDHPTLTGEDEQKLNIVGRFLQESEEAKNKEGFIKIYRHPFLQKPQKAKEPAAAAGSESQSKRRDPNDTDALVDLIVRETTSRRQDHNRRTNNNKTNWSLDPKSVPFSPSPSSSNSTPTRSPRGSGKDAGYGSSGRSGLSSQIDSSKNIVLLFDLNGTLINKTDARKKMGIRVRPFISKLIELHRNGFTLGIYSSATLKTCSKAETQITDEIRWQDQVAETRGAAEGKQQEAFFKHVLHREFCEMAPGLNGKAWDTVKPLAKHVSDINRCILFDDDEYKVLEGERDHHVLVPAWKKDDNLDDILVCLVDSTLKHIKSSQQDKDIRMAAAKISLDLLEHYEKEEGSAGTNTTRATANADASALTSELETLNLQPA